MYSISVYEPFAAHVSSVCFRVVSSVQESMADVQIDNGDDASVGEL